MLIKALSDYYDVLERAGKILPEGYSNVKIHYVIALTEKGNIDEIIDYQVEKEVKSGKGKYKKIPKELKMPQRTQKTSIDANIVEHRPLYIFGLNYEEDENKCVKLTPNDNTNKAQKSHEAFVSKNLEFIENLDSPLINAYRLFLKNWNPEEETENEMILSLGKKYSSYNFAFSLTGHPEQLLQDEPEIIEKWEKYFTTKNLNTEGDAIAQCAVTGKREPIARIHDKIKGVYGGSATGTVLVGFNNTSENSYGNEQSYNSNISKTIMKKYTEALNYLLSNEKHRIVLDDITILFWAMDSSETYEDVVNSMLWGDTDKMTAETTQDMLKELMEDAVKGQIESSRIQSTDHIKEDVDFYMIGLKANKSRISLKFIVRKKYSDILWNIARFQNDLRVTKEIKTAKISWIINELKSPKSKNEKINPALISKLFESVIYGYSYPTALLERIVHRIKIDGGDEDVKKKWLRVGLVKACINRNYPKERLEMALDKENHNQAYLCGRLFAVLEKIQAEASNNTLNRTIKDSYFSAASSKPILIFPKIIKLSQNHLNKLTLKQRVYFNKLTGEIIDSLDGDFPESLLLKEQGKFIVGYYQQYQSFYEKSNKKETN